MPPRRTQAPKTRELTPAERPSIAAVTILGTPVLLVPYHDKEEKRTVLSIYHNDYRHVWIAQNNPILYTHQRVQGLNPNDITCYYEPHHTWGPDRQDWPDIIFQYEPDQRSRRKTKPEWLYTPEGWLVLDFKSHPVLDYKMPLTLASVCEDFVMEGIMRENHLDHIGVQDLLARMPGKIINGKEPSRVGTVSMRMNRFRRMAGCITWGPKIGSEAIKGYMDNLLPDTCKQANSTRGFRSLYKHEEAEIDMINVGLYPNKARHGQKDFSNEKQDAMYRKARDKFLKLKADFDRMSAPPFGAGSLHDNNMLHLVQHPDLTTSSATTSQHLSDLRSRAAAGGSSSASSSNTPTAFHHTSMTLLPSTTHISNLADSTATHEQLQSLLQPQDLRHLPPTTQAHLTLNALLLAPTIHHYTYLTGEFAPETSETASYQRQYEQLQYALHSFVDDEEIEEEGKLVGLVEWTRGSIQWNLPWDGEAFGAHPEVRVVEGLMGGL